MRLLIIRPQPAAQRTATLARLAGYDPVILPLFELAPLPWQVADAQEFDGLLITSANAIHFAGEALDQLAGLPLLVVGPASARAARQRGIEPAIIGQQGKAELLQRAQVAGYRHLLWLTGQHHMSAQAGDEKIIAATRIAYESRKCMPSQNFPQVVKGCDVAALHSPRAARHFADCCDRAGLNRQAIAIAAFSGAVASAAGDGWRQVEVADSPDDRALMTAIGRLGF